MGCCDENEGILQVLGFGRNAEPFAPLRTFNKTLDLKKLQEIADRIVADDDVPRHETASQVQEFLLVGTSMGGARPKAVVEDDEGLCLAKFNRCDDKWNNARIEHAMLQLGRRCGLTTAESRVVPIAERDVLLVKGFDRKKVHDGYTRSRMVSALTLLRTEDTSLSRERWSYLRYASFYRQNLPIGSGATESTCWQIQQRVKLPGQSWFPEGLRGVLAIRALVLSDRWESFWDHDASSHRAEVRIAA